MHPSIGTGSFTVPLTVSPGRAGFAPQLVLSYDSGAGNGPFGFGWQLSIPAISRKTDKGLPQYHDAEETDVFILSGAEDLVPVLQPDGSRFVDTTTAAGYTIHRYSPRVEGLFARIERWTHRASGDVHWRSISRDNITTLYGNTPESRIADSERVFSWLICESYDDKGNAIVYEYAAEDDANVDFSQASERNRLRSANRYLKRVKYGNTVSRLLQADLTATQWMFEVVLDYDEDHYEELDLDPARPEREQHRFVRASLQPGSRWAVRPDPFSSHRPCFEVRTYRRCRRVLTFHRFSELGDEPWLVRATEFGYADLDYAQSVATEAELSHPGSTRFASFICSVTQSGFVRDPAQGVLERGDARYGTYLKKSLPPVEFEYSKAVIQDAVLELDDASLQNLPIGLDGTIYRWVDLDGEGVAGILTEQASSWFYKPNLGQARFGPLQAIHAKPSLSALDRGRQQLVDLAGDGQLDLVAFAGPTPGFYERTQDEDWEPFRAFRELPGIRWDEPNLRLVDLDGDGLADILITGSDEIFTWYPSLAHDGFGPAAEVHQPPDEERGPRLVLADGTQSIYLADMCGDGLTDLVRIRNGEACYWPSLGYGRFGPKITMGNAPWLDNPGQFDQRRLRLADIDGSGTTDMIYLSRDGVRLYFNQSGNRWSEARRLHGFPHVDDLSSVVTADLLGNGTACLVWSSPSPGETFRYIDLMGGTKPHLLIKSVNNLGTETDVTYAASTTFYLADKRAGKPWITRIPFPVHVVERVETYDWISRNRFVTRYAYHHGYYDGAEREFRGFGLVEHWDTEEFAALSAEGQLPDATNVDSSSHVPPVLTRTWFHTGVYAGRDHISDFFAGPSNGGDGGQYYREPGMTDAQARALLLDDTVLPDGLTAEEEREACRALKGSMLRQEVYAIDGTSEEKQPDGGTGKQTQPYTVTEQNFTIRPLQRQMGNRHAVFFTHAREAISYHYERTLVPVLNGEIVSPDANPAVQWLPDPRVTHVLTLETDDFGNVLKTATAGYGRRYTDPGLPSQSDRDKQSHTFLTYSEAQVTNVIDTAEAYRAPVHCETRTYELTGYVPSGAAGRFQPSDLVRPDLMVPARLSHIFDKEISYEDQPANGKQRRLIEQVRTLFRPDDLGVSKNDPLTLLRLGLVESLAMAGETYKLAFTPGLLAQVYQRPGQPSENLLPNPADVLGGPGGERGGYLRSQDAKATGAFPGSDPDDYWWIPSGRTFCSPNSGDTAAQELAYARQHFFLPHRYRDPFHTDAASTETFISYDGYDLLLSETRDAAGNVVTVTTDDGTGHNVTGLDYRVLQPYWVTDPNRNRSRVCFDALGLVAGTAVMGKATENLGDSLDGFEPHMTPAQIDDLLDAADPHAPALQLLKDATTRIVYDLDRFWATRQANPGDESRWLAACSATLARETHAADPAPPGGLKVRISFAYSDGFGREIQQKVQAEPGTVPARDAGGRIIMGTDGQPQMTAGAVSPRWVASGWTIFNNKGKPVRRYEPFFTDTHRFEFDVRAGVSPVLFYDPAERVVGTLHPNHTWEKIAFSPWQQETWDVNDTVKIADPAQDTDVGSFFARLPHTGYLPTWQAQRQGGALGPRELAAAAKTAVHAGTTTVAHADPLGRTILTVAHNKLKYSDSPATDPPAQEYYHTRVVFDIEGNQREVVDAKDRLVMSYAYDMLGNRIHQASMEAGARWTLNDAAGKPLLAWDSRDHRFRIAYDPLQRPADSFLREGAGAELLVGRTVYGEKQPTPQAHNLCMKAVQVFDQAGVVTTSEYDFKGNLLSSQRQLAKQYQTILDWSGPVPLEAGTYTHRTAYDALNRPAQLTSPDNSLTRLHYNEANLLERIDANVGGIQQDGQPVWTPFITGIDYDAKGQRTLIVYGNGVSTSYGYDLFTFRLARLLTRRDPAAYPDDCPQPPPAGWAGCQVQNLSYTYDPAGNITHIQDDAQQTIFFNNKRVKPSADYTYDATYRLIEATGREHLGQVGGAPVPSSYNDAPRVGLPHPNDGRAMGTYLERYLYDYVGNFQQMIHRGSDPANPGWTRAYTYTEPSLLEPGSVSNRLTSTTIGASTERYSVGGNGYDPHGNMLWMPQLQVMRRDFRDQLQMTQRQAVSPADDDGVRHQGERTWYVYDATGQRVRKVTESATGQLKEERIYLGGFEIYRTNGASPLQRETLHIMDGKQRIALVETRTQGNEPGVPPRLIRYQFANHLGSASLELDDKAQIISYEEYTPYGSTSYQAVSGQIETSKRYRYTGKERDEETGLYYHDARYYISWLGRWASTDPAGLHGGISLYTYAADNPANATDLTGTSPNWLEEHIANAVETARRGSAAVREVASGVVAAQHDIIREVVATSPVGQMAGGIATVHGLASAPDSGAFIKETVKSRLGALAQSQPAPAAALHEFVVARRQRETTRGALIRAADAFTSKLPFNKPATDLEMSIAAAGRGDVAGMVKNAMVGTYHFGREVVEDTLALEGAAEAKGTVIGAGRNSSGGAAPPPNVPSLPATPSPLPRPSMASILQHHAIEANARLALDPTLAAQLNLLRPRSLALAQSGSMVPARYGQALENLIDLQLRSNPRTDALFLRLGGPRRPDWVPRTAAGRNYDFIQGQNFDVFTLNPIETARHLSRPYGPRMSTIYYMRPPNYRFR